MLLHDNLSHDGIVFTHYHHLEVWSVLLLHWSSPITTKRGIIRWVVAAATDFFCFFIIQELQHCITDTIRNRHGYSYLLSRFPFKLEYDDLTGGATNHQHLTQCTQVQLVNSKPRVIAERVVDSDLQVNTFLSPVYMYTSSTLITERVVDSDLQVNTFLSPVCVHVYI